MPSLRERLKQRDVPPAEAWTANAFFVAWTALAGFFFVFGLLFILVVVGFTIWGLTNGQRVAAGDAWVFYAIFVPVMIAYQCVSWWFFRIGLRMLRGDPRQHDPFDAEGRPKQPPAGIE